MSKTVESTPQEENVDEALRTEKKLSDENDRVSMNQVGREEGFFPCRVTELRTIEPEEFNELKREEFDENYCALRSGFDFMEDETFDKLERYGLQLPDVKEDIITVKYKLVGADEEWEMREFWMAEDFPKRSYLRTVPDSRIGNLLGKVVPIIEQRRFGRNGKDRKYIIASLADNNSYRYETEEASRKRSVPKMTVYKHFDMIKFKILTTILMTFGPIGIVTTILGHSNPRIVLPVLLCLTIPYLVLSGSDWFYARVYNIVGDVKLPSNPYHNQFESISAFADETTL